MRPWLVPADANVVHGCTRVVPAAGLSARSPLFAMDPVGSSTASMECSACLSSCLQSILSSSAVTASHCQRWHVRLVGLGAVFRFVCVVPLSTVSFVYLFVSVCLCVSLHVSACLYCLVFVSILPVSDILHTSPPFAARFFYRRSSRPLVSAPRLSSLHLCFVLNQMSQLRSVYMLGFADLISSARIHIQTPTTTTIWVASPTAFSLPGSTFHKAAPGAGLL